MTELGYGHAGRQMKHGIDLVLVNQASDEFAVADVAFLEKDRLGDGVAGGIRQVVENDDPVAGIGKPVCGVGADVPGAACDQDVVVLCHFARPAPMSGLAPEAAFYSDGVSASNLASAVRRA